MPTPPEEPGSTSAKCTLTEYNELQTAVSGLGLADLSHIGNYATWSKINLALLDVLQSDFTLSLCYDCEANRLRSAITYCASEIHADSCTSNLPTIQAAYSACLEASVTGWSATTTPASGAISAILYFPMATGFVLIFLRILTA